MLDDVLNHEAAFWRRYAGVADHDVRTQRRWRREMERLVAAVALRGGLPHADNLPTLRAALHLDALPGDDGLADLLADLYPAIPAADADRTGWVAPLEPDLLAEALVRCVLGSKDQRRDTLEAALTDADARDLGSTLTVLGHIEVRGHAQAGDWLDRALALCQGPALRSAFDVALALSEKSHASTLGQRLAARLRAAGSSELADQLAQAVPWPTVSMREIGLWAHQRRYDAVGPTTPPEDRATRAGNLGLWENEVGHRDAALSATEEAVSIRRELASSRPDAFLPDLAMSLGARGQALRAADDVEGAGAHFREGMESLWPLFERAHQAFAQLTLALLRDCLDTFGHDPAPDWLAPYVGVFQRLMEPAVDGG